MLQKIFEFFDRKLAEPYDVYVYQGGWERRHITMGTSKRKVYDRYKNLYGRYGMEYLPIAVVRKNR